MAKRRLTGAWYLLFAPLLIFGGLRIVIKLSDRFQESPEAGIAGLWLAAGMAGSILVVACVIGWIMERVMRKRARDASGTSILMPMHLGLESYGQAFDISGEVNFKILRHEGVFLVLRNDAFEFYAGFQEYEGPLFVIPFVDVIGLTRAEVVLVVGKEPGVVIETNKGPFELGFVRSAAFRGRKTPMVMADQNFARLESALDEWRSQQARESNSGLQA